MASTFEYFDQFTPVEINLNLYLDIVKEDNGYDYKFTNIQPVRTTLSNIFDKIDLVMDFKKDVLNFDNYTIQDGDRIETVSDKKYDTIDYWWLIALFNNIKNMFTDWPMTQAQLNTLAEELYITEGLYNKTTYYDLLFERNETKRNLILPKPLMVSPITSRFRTVFEESAIVRK